MNALRQRLTDVGLDPRRVGRVRWIKKARILRAAGVSPLRHLGYVFADPEIDNFTYELANEDELVDWLAGIFEADRGTVALHVSEARSDPALYGTLAAATKSRWSMKTEPPIGRRIGWYVAVRLLRPTRVVETGIHDGLGSLVLLSALDRNAADGYPGDLVSFDVDATAGWIVGEHPRWSRRIMSSRDGLASALAEAPAQLFIHDSLHTYDHERFELDAAADGLAPGGWLLSDNSHATSALQDVCMDRGLRFTFFRERPRGHFYAGGGIGLGGPLTRESG